MPLTRQLISYIAPGAPATRRPATGSEPFLRPEIGFTPQWFRVATGIDFGEAWHTQPAVRLRTNQRMRHELERRFPGIPSADAPVDILTGTFGASFVAALYGVPIEYQPANWPWSAKRYLTDAEADRLEPPRLDHNPAFAALWQQLDWIAAETGTLAGYMNWQGVLNNAYRLRGEDLFLDMATEPERARHVFECVTSTMIEAARRLYARQRAADFHVEHFTVSNCLVNLVSPAQYRDLLLPFDRRIAEEFGCLGVHNCAWSATPYIDHYASLPSLAYIDMGIKSDLPRARAAFPQARRAIMYTPMDVANKTSDEIQADLNVIARDYAPCDIVFADIEAGTPDSRVVELVRFCEEISSANQGR